MESTTVSEPNETTAGQGAGAVRAPAASAGAGAAVGSRTEISPPNPPLRLRIISIFVTALVIAAAIILVSRSRNMPTAETVARAGSETVPADPNVVTLDASQNGDIKTESASLAGFAAEKIATGKIGFNEDNMTPVFSPYTGRVTRLIAKPGDIVRQGSPLFDIDTPDLVQTETDLLTAAAGISKAKTTLDLAKRTEERQHRLYDNKAAALKDWEQAQSDLKNAESDLRVAEAADTAARDRLRVFGKTNDEVAALEATRRIDRSTRVLSPISGTIIARKVGPGQYVKPDNPDPLFTIANLSRMWMLADVYETDVPLIRAGQPVEVQVLALPSETFRARISYIGPSVDPNTHRVPVRCEVENKGEKLKPEMLARFKITTSPEVESIAVLKSAIVRDGEKTSVWVANGGNKFTRREVTLGLEKNGRVQVLSGLQPDEKVVYDGSLFLSNLARS